MNKIIWKSILATLASTLILCGVLALACAWFFPPTLMEFSYNVGWDKTAMKYAQKSYERFEESYYAAYALEIAADLGLDDKTEQYAEELLSCKDFESYCSEQDARFAANVTEGEKREEGTYKQYVYVKLCLAKYRLNKAEEAVQRAAASLGAEEGGSCREFPVNNALAAVLLYALDDGDTQTVDKISGILSSTDESALGQNDKDYLAAMKNLIVQNTKNT